MAKRDAFVIPAGLKLSSGADGITIENEGDVVIHSTLGQRLARVRSKAGDIVLHTEVEAGLLEAAGQVVCHGTLRAGVVRARGISAHALVVADRLEGESLVELHGPAEVKSLHGETVVFDGPTLVGRVVEARRSIRIGKSKIEADILIAPSVLLDPGATGKVKVLESQNDIGPHAVRGCLRLADLEDVGGNADAFLAERGLKPLGGDVTPVPTRPTPVVVPAAPAQVAAAPAPERADPILVSTARPAPTLRSSSTVPPPPVVPPPVVAPVAPAPVPAAPAAPAAGGGRSLADEQLDTQHDDGPPAAAYDPVQSEIAGILDRIVACYDPSNLPPSLTDLRDWLARKDYTAMREGITGAWNQLLKFHAKHGLRMRPQVNNDFNMLNTIVRKL